MVAVLAAEVGEGRDAVEEGGGYMGDVSLGGVSEVVRRAGTGEGVPLRPKACSFQ